jgi:hypothetical protein
VLPSLHIVSFCRRVDFHVISSRPRGQVTESWGRRVVLYSGGRESGRLDNETGRDGKGRENIVVSVLYVFSCMHVIVRLAL